MATQGVTAIHKRRTLWQWLKGYTGQKYMTTALFLAIPVALLILFTIIPAVNMIIFSFQQRDQLGVNVQWVGFDNYKTLFTDMAIFQRSSTACTTLSARLYSSDLRFSSQLCYVRNKARRTVQGSYLLPLSYERRCSCAYLPEILQRR